MRGDEALEDVWNVIRSGALVCALGMDWVCGYEVVTVLAPKWVPSMRWFGGFSFGFAYHALIALVVQLYVPWGWANYGIVVGLLAVVGGLVGACDGVQCR
jgi:hypothetical protein